MKGISVKIKIFGSMFILYFFIFFQFNNTDVVINDNGLDWNEGMVLLNNKESYKGQISFNDHTNIVLCRIDNITKAFPAHQVEGFWFFDQELSINRFFVAQDFPVKRNLKRKIFLEMVLMGEIPIYRLGKSKKRPNKAPEFADFSYYALIDNDYVQLKDFGKAIYPILLMNYESEIKEYIKEKNIKPYELIDQIRLIGFYNSSQITNNETSANLKMYNLTN